MLSSGTPGEVEMQSSLGLEWERHSSKLSTEMKTVDSGAQLLSPHTYTYTNVYLHGPSDVPFNHPVDISPINLCDKLTRAVLPIDLQSSFKIMKRTISALSRDSRPGSNIEYVSCICASRRFNSSLQSHLSLPLGRILNPSRASRSVLQENDSNDEAHSPYEGLTSITTPSMNQLYMGLSLADNLGSNLFSGTSNYSLDHSFLQTGTAPRPTLPVLEIYSVQNKRVQVTKKLSSRPNGVPIDLSGLDQVYVSGIYTNRQFESSNTASNTAFKSRIESGYLQSMDSVSCCGTPSSRVSTSSSRAYPLSFNSPKQNLRRYTHPSPRISESQYQPPNGGAYVPFGVPEDHYLSVPWERQFPSPNEHQRSVHIPNTSTYSGYTGWDDPQNLTKKSHMSDYWGHPHLDEHLIQSESIELAHNSLIDRITSTTGPHKEPDLGGGLPRRCALCQSSDCSEKTCHWKGWCNESDGLKIHDLSATRKRQRDDDEQTPPDAPSLKRVKVQYEAEVNEPIE